MKESPEILKSNGKILQNIVAKKNYRKSAGDSSKAAKQNEVIKDYSFLSKILSQLCLFATDPMDGIHLYATVIAFFTNFRASVAPSSSVDQELGNSMGRKRDRK